MQSSNSQKLEDALVLLNQKSEEIEVLESRLAAQEAQIEHLQLENYRIQVEYEKLSVAQEVQREVLEDAKGNVSELGVHIEWVQGLLDKSEAKGKQLRGEIDEIRDTLDAKVGEHNLARIEWGHERAALEAKITSPEVPSQQPPAGWELEKKELENTLAEFRTERDQLNKDKLYAENEVETWKEQFKREFIHSQELRQDAKDSKAEASRVRGENAILASQTKEAVRLVTAKYEAAVEKLRKELAKAESLYRVLQAKDEQTGDVLRDRAASATELKDQILRLQEGLDSRSAEKAPRAAQLEGGESPSPPRRASLLNCQRKGNIRASFLRTEPDAINVLSPPRYGDFREGQQPHSTSFCRNCGPMLWVVMLRHGATSDGVFCVSVLLSKRVNVLTDM